MKVGDLVMMRSSVTRYRFGYGLVTDVDIGDGSDHHGSYPGYRRVFFYKLKELSPNGKWCQSSALEVISEAR